MKKRFSLVCGKAKKPYVLGYYTTRKAAEQALKIYERKHQESIDLQRKYPGQGIEDLFNSLKIIGPENE